MWRFRSSLTADPRALTKVPSQDDCSHHPQNVTACVADTGKLLQLKHPSLCWVTTTGLESIQHLALVTPQMRF